jgi:hypothetical protein
MSKRDDTRSQLIANAVAVLHEHCDAVQVLASWSEDGCTHFRHVGSGNWYARQGMAQSFQKIDTAQENAQEIARVMDQGEF